MGLVFAAMAGYDPAVAVPFWKRMAAMSGGNQNDLFSDHPSDAKRIAAIQVLMPTAERYYRASGYASQSITIKAEPKPTRKAVGKSGRRTSKR